jgi:hypothetical protein
MRRRMWMTGAALATLALLVVQGAAADQSYSDPAGDPSGGAPDVTAIAVANDGAGKITFDISVAGLPAADTFIDVPMNTDLNASTGDQGIDHEFFFSGSLGIGLLLRWNGTELAPVTVPSMRSSYANGVVHLEVNRADMGNTSAFVFWVSSLKVSGNQVVGVDDAPDGTAVYQYTLAQHPACSDKIDNDGDGKIDAPADPGCSSATDTDETDPPPPPPPLKLAAGKPRAVAGPAKAASAFTVAMTVARSDGKPFTGAVRCKAKAGAATLRAAGRAVAGAARCTMRLPKGAKGKKLSGSITATAGSASVSKPYAFAIR